jgi:hypothetical protein
MRVVCTVGFVWGAIVLVLLGRQVFLGIRRGFIPTRGLGTFYRDDNPVAFWVVVALHLPILSIALAFVLCGLFNFSNQTAVKGDRLTFQMGPP